MNMVSDKINRSYSESDLHLSQFDNLSITSPRDLSKYQFQNSCSSIIRRVYVEEIVSFNRNQPNMRSDDLDNIMQATNIKRRDTLYRSIDNNLVRDMRYINSYYDNDDDEEEVPMEIDSSYTEERFPKMMGTDSLRSRVKRYETSVLDEPDTTIEQIQIPPRIKETRVIHINLKKKNRSTKLILTLASLLLVFLFFYYPIIIDHFVSNEIQIENLQKDLEMKVHGHKHLIDIFINILENRTTWSEKLKVISFVGSQGVGKTFFADVIRSHFPQHLAHEIYGNQLYYDYIKRTLIDSINDCCLNLIVIDDLRLDDNLDLFSLAYSLPKDSFILLISIFNSHYTNDDLNTVFNYEDVIKIRESFDNSGIKNHELFVFEDFSHDQIKDWMIKQLNTKNVSSSIREEILQNVLETHNIRHGLKGLNSKILLELQKYR